MPLRQVGRIERINDEWVPLGDVECKTYHSRSGDQQGDIRHDHRRSRGNDNARDGRWWHSRGVGDTLHSHGRTNSGNRGSSSHKRSGDGRFQQKRAVLGAARKRTDLIERRCEGYEPKTRHATIGRLHTGHAAKGRRLADRSAGIAPQG